MECPKNSKLIKEHKNLGPKFLLKEHVLVAHNLKHTIHTHMKLLVDKSKDKFRYAFVLQIIFY